MRFLSTHPDRSPAPPGPRRPRWLGTSVAGLALVVGAAPTGARASVRLDRLHDQPDDRPPAQHLRRRQPRRLPPGRQCAGVGTVTGGIVIGKPAGLTAYTGTGNLYGTSFDAGPGFTIAVTLSFDPTITVSGITASLYNGETDLEDFTATAYSGSIAVATQKFTDVRDLSLPSSVVNFSLPNLSGLSVTSVVFSATGSFASSSYNYFVGPIGVTYTPLPRWSPSRPAWRCSASGSPRPASADAGGSDGSRPGAEKDPAAGLAPLTGRPPAVSWEVRADLPGRSRGPVPASRSRRHHHESIHRIRDARGAAPGRLEAPTADAPGPQGVRPRGHRLGPGGLRGPPAALEALRAPAGAGGRPQVVDHARRGSRATRSTSA